MAGSEGGGRVARARGIERTVSGSGEGRIECVEARDVTKSYGAVMALRGVSARFEAGSVTVVEGANGAGKSTLLGVLGGLVRPTRGRVWVEPGGEIVGGTRGLVGWVGHEGYLYAGLTVRENVELAARLQGMVVALAWGEVAERFGLEGIGGRRTGELSRGQRQRVALARGMVGRPAVLLLDEPWAGLDGSGRSRLDAVIGEERARGTVVVVVAHEADTAERLRGRRIRLERGALRLDATG